MVYTPRLWALGLPLGVMSILGMGDDPQPGAAPGAAGNGTCLECHAGIEDIHPGFELTCVDCHGGDDTQSDSRRAHVLPRLPVPTDERVLPRNYDLPYQRFVNPTNLRVAQATCGDCHQTAVSNMLKSLHATTAGHLGDGFYEHGLTRSKTPVYSIFPVRDEDGDLGEHGIRATRQIPPFRNVGKDRIETHYSDLPRKACMHCHLYSEGRAVDGRVGMDGDCNATIEITAAVGCWQLVSKLTNALAIPLEEGIASWPPDGEQP